MSVPGRRTIGSAVSIVNFSEGGVSACRLWASLKNEKTFSSGLASQSSERYSKARMVCFEARQSCGKNYHEEVLCPKYYHGWQSGARDLGIWINCCRAALFPLQVV